MTVVFSTGTDGAEADGVAAFCSAGSRKDGVTAAATGLVVVGLGVEGAFAATVTAAVVVVLICAGATDEAAALTGVDSVAGTGTGASALPALAVVEATTAPATGMITGASLSATNAAVTASQRRRYRSSLALMTPPFV